MLQDLRWYCKCGPDHNGLRQDRSTGVVHQYLYTPGLRRKDHNLANWYYKCIALETWWYYKCQLYSQGNPIHQSTSKGVVLEYLYTRSPLHKAHSWVASV